MKEILTSLFGTYTPVTYFTTDGVEVVAAGAAGVDWEYVLGIALFGLCLYCFFRILGVLFKRF